MPTLEATAEDTRMYELCVLYPHPLGQKEMNTAKKAVDTILSDAGGKEVSKDEWGTRGLAYTIGGCNEGVFVVYYYELNPGAINQIEQELKITPNVLRHILVKPPKGYVIENYSEKYEQWLKDREVAKDEQAKQKEEDLKKRMLSKQKVRTKKPEAAEKPVETEEAVEKVEEKVDKIEKDDLDAEIDKLIADDDLEL